MPTVILLDVSLSMSQIVTTSESSEEIQRRQLAVHGINTLLDHLSSKVKLEFVSLVIFSSLWEQVVGFTRDYSTIRNALSKIDEYNKTCIESALNGVGSLIMEEWGSSTQCQIILITDGNSGVGEGSLKKSFQKYKDRSAADTISSDADEKFPLPYPFPCTLNIMCICPPGDKHLESSLPHYEKLIELNRKSGQVYHLDGNITTKSVETMFKTMCEDYFTPFMSTLKCGNLKCPVHMFPAPDKFKEDYDFDHIAKSPGREIRVCGFLTIADVSSPPYLSRHLVLPIASDTGNIKNDGNKQEDEDEEKDLEESKAPAFTVLLHGSLKVEGMVALVTIQEDWYGLLYSWADNKKKSNLMLSLFKPGTDLLPWLGNLKHLAPVGDFSEPPYGDDDKKTPFPVRPLDRRSYTQGCVVWIKQSGLQADIQKILRNARKIPEKQQHFYKELNRLRKAALSFGFFELFDSVAQLLERECALLPSNAHPDTAMQLTHAANSLRKPVAMDYSNNIMPIRTNYSSD